MWTYVATMRHLYGPYKNTGGCTVSTRLRLPLASLALHALQSCPWPLFSLAFRIYSTRPQPSHYSIRTLGSSRCTVHDSTRRRFSPFCTATASAKVHGSTPHLRPPAPATRTLRRRADQRRRPALGLAAASAPRCPSPAPDPAAAHRGAPGRDEPLEQAKASCHPGDRQPRRLPTSCPHHPAAATSTLGGTPRAGTAGIAQHVSLAQPHLHALAQTHLHVPEIGKAHV
jgi:hypothetical protein